MLRTVLVAAIYTACVWAAAPEPKTFQRPPVFEPNRGQFPERVKWAARGPGYQLSITDEGATFKLIQATAALQTPLPYGAYLRPEPLSTTAPKPAYSAMQMKLSGGRPWTVIKGLEPTGGVTNYMLGDDPRQWRAGVQHYARLRIDGVYEGIDLVLYSNGGQLEYDFVVAAGADPKQIRLAFEGVEQIQVEDKSGDLVLTSATGAQLRHMRPKVYQETGERRVELAGGYQVLSGRQVAFTLDEYDRGGPLIIDPEVVYLKNLKGWDPNNSYDRAMDVAVDPLGNAWVTGYSYSEYLTVETVKGSSVGDGMAAGRTCRDHRQDSPPNPDVFVSKIAPDGALLWITFLGGCEIDQGNSIAVDATGGYVTGYTESTHFPQVNSFQKLLAGDAFVTKLSPSGTILYSTYLGGPGQDTGNAIAVDSSHNAYVVGIASKNFPVVGAMQPNFGGVTDAFIAKVNSTGTGLIYATYLGGSNFDHANGVAVDSAGHAYVTGVTNSPNFPALGDSSYLGGPSAYVTKLSPQGDALMYSVYLGGGDDLGKEIEVDVAGNAYITGETKSARFPTTAGAFQISKPSSAGVNSAFVTKMSGTGAVLFSTYFSGKDGETEGRDIAVNSFGEVYVCGLSSATMIPGGVANGVNGFIAKLSPQLNALQYTFLHGADVGGLAVSQTRDRRVDVYAAGRDDAQPSGSDGFVIRLSELPVLSQ